jgi:hypothetical protein
MPNQTPRQQFDSFLSRYTPEIRRVAKAAVTKMRKRLPGSIELVYDNYNALVIGFGPTERASDAIFSLALYPRWVTLFFLQGATLPDKHKLLKGSGKFVRHIVLEDASTLDLPPVKDLISLALKQALTPIDGKTRGRMVIKSVSAKQRPRKPKTRS